MNPFFERDIAITRRQFFSRTATGLGGAALASMAGGLGLNGATGQASGSGPIDGLPHHFAKAKRVIYLMQGGGPSHVDLLDPKPGLSKYRGVQLPDSVRMGQRLTTMTSGQLELPVLPSIKPFRRYGNSGLELSELLPYTGGIADDICVVNSMHTEAINHAPACTFFLTGSQIPGRPSMGAWVSYGLGSENENMPTFVAMTSRDRENSCGQLLFDYYWGSGFIPSKYQGVRFRGEGDPVLYLSNPKGVPRELRKGLLKDLETLNQQKYEDYGDPETATRIAQYEMAFRMQSSVPELTDITTEPQHILDMYGPDVHRPGSYARNCLLARRLAEKGVRFIQLMHAGWDQHGNLPTQLEIQCRDTDQPSAALVKDLKQRGLLEDTLVIWAGEFGRTVFGQGNIENETKHGRDHHGRAFSLWMAGGGVKPGIRYGKTDDFAWNIVQDPVHVHDFQATIMHLLGVDHERLTYRYQGRRFRLTDVHGKVVKGLLA
ncbi:MAG: DUF1501 domain-containing protein [Opitutales bacterium]|jgi:hypothetical protein|nr:DUF1501 domain-containing protein [Opitutales bacterium]MBT5813683.1 DUF1501 domain-containing protein [Opitutales bacterium]